MTIERSAKLRGRYHFLPIICKLRDQGWTNERIAELLDCHISTIKYTLRNAVDCSAQSNVVNELGEPNDEWLRVAAVYRCLEFLTVRGWQAGETDSKCVYDVFAIKNDKIIKLQVRSSTRFSNRGWPSFKTCRILHNTKRAVRVSFVPGDFDYWFFYSTNGDAWVIPFAEIGAKAEISMEGYDQYFI